MGYGELGYHPPTPTLTPLKGPAKPLLGVIVAVSVSECLFFPTKSWHRSTFADRIQLQDGGIGGFWIPQHRKKLIRTPHHLKKSWRNTDTANIFRFTMINMAYMAFWKKGKCPHVIKYFARTNTELSATFEIAGKKFLSSRTVIIDRRSQSFLGGSEAIPPENFYILSP